MGVGSRSVQPSWLHNVAVHVHLNSPRHVLEVPMRLCDVFLKAGFLKAGKIDIRWQLAACLIFKLFGLLKDLQGLFVAAATP